MNLDNKQKLNRKDILAKAEACVCGQREEDYGTPEDNFGVIANLWSVYLHGVNTDNLTSEDVSMMMVLLKVARIKNNGGTIDSYVDIAGYAACGGEIHGEWFIEDKCIKGDKE